MENRYRLISITVFTLLAIVSFFALFRLNYSFEFEQFFPQGDPELEFFKKFIEDFEVDDNFLLVAVERKAGVFDAEFLKKFHDYSLKIRDLECVTQVQSLTQFSYPLKTPFAITTIPAIHMDSPDRYEKDRARILADERFVGNLISEDATALAIFMKTKPSMQLEESMIMMEKLDSLTALYAFENHYYLGRPYFQNELVEMQKKELMGTTLFAGALVIFIMFWIFRRPAGVIIALISIGLGMLLFMGFMGWTGRELNAISALYPVLMIIVGTSDVIHIMSKYIDELRKGKDRQAAIKITIKEIGLATFFTSATTAIGFASLLTSRVYPIQDFGINSAIGVLIAYITVLFFTTALLSRFDTAQLIKLGRGQAFWDKSMSAMYYFTKRNPKRIAWGALLTLLLSFWGISKISTNYTIINNLPTKSKITMDFSYFEQKFTGFRPLEYAVFAQNDYAADDFEVLREMNKIEQHLKTYPQVRATNSLTDVYKTINQMHGSNRPETYLFPEEEKTFNRYRRLVDKMPNTNVNVALSKDKKKARITSRMTDFGADSIKSMAANIDQWILENTDTNILRLKRTGTGLIIDKNAEYVRRDLLYGLALAIVVVSLLMALLFQNWRMLLVSLVPNIFPLLLAGAMLGFLGIELEAGVSIIFAIIFGIAVDDTIHFLSKFRLALGKGLDTEAALLITFQETGKAICLTSIILFFGFLIMLFSVHPPSVAIGLLISITLFSAVFADLLLIPLLIRWFLGEKKA